MTPTDGFALTMLILISAVMGCFAGFLAVIALRQKRRKNDPVRDLIEEVSFHLEREESEKKRIQKSPKTKNSKSPTWEKDPDWWKQ